MNSNLAYQDEPWEELIGGKVVLMSPRPNINHNHISQNIYRIFDDYLDGKPCTPFADGVDLYLTEEDRFIPDGMIVCDPEKIKTNGVHGAPDLVVEILSNSSAKKDRIAKKRVYEKTGVREYWIVDPNNHSIEVCLLKNGLLELDNIYSVYPDWELEKMKEEERAEVPAAFRCSLFDDLEIRIRDVFRRVL